MCRFAVIAIMSSFLCVILLPTEPFAASKTWSGRLEDRNGVEHAINPGQGMEPDVSLATQEDWRHGGEDDDVLFGVIGDIVRDGRGNTYMLDTQLTTVHCIDVDGRYRGTIGRSGEGPAEFLYASGLTLLSDSVACVTQMMPGRAVLMTTKGDALGDYPLPRDEGTPYVKGCAAFGDRLGLYTAALVERETSVGLRAAFIAVNRGGDIVTTFWENFQTADFANMTFDEKADADPVWAFGPDGTFFVNNDWDAYAIEMVGPDGNRRMVFELDYEHRPRTQVELDAIDGQKRSGETPGSTEVSPTARDVARIVPRALGTVWVLSSRGEMNIPEGMIASFEEFDSSGRFVRRISIEGAFRPGVDAFHLVGDRVFVVIGAGEISGTDSSTEKSAAGDDNSVICLSLVTSD